MKYNLELISIFKYNHFVINKNLESISQQLSLKEPEAGGNSMNWVLGHIVINRDGVLKLLKQDPMCDGKMEKIYVKASHIKENKESVKVDKLLRLYNDIQDVIIKTLSDFNPEENREAVLNIAGYAFHEAYHSGQLGVLRRVIGKKGKLKYK